jgi:hypothetical protein
MQPTEAQPQTPFVVPHSMKPIAFTISAFDVRMLYATGTTPTAYNQLLLAKLKDHGGPVEGMGIKYKLTHGQLFKMKDNLLAPQEEFTYLWLDDAYVEGLKNVGGVA